MCPNGGHPFLLGGSMKKLDRLITIPITVLTLAAFIATAQASPSLASTPSKVLHRAGRAVSTSANTIRNGRGAPANSLGVDGDFYIDTLKLNMYGPKVNGVWPAPISLRGPAGVDGKSGTNGIEGKTGATGSNGNTSSTAGQQGARGPTGPQGSQGISGTQGLLGSIGLTGEVGPTGPTGPIGPIGSTGLTGGNGPAGSSGSSGANGPIGPIGLAGSPGATGLTGSNGLTGAQGLTGPSQVSIGSISFPQQIRGGTGTSVNSSIFGNFAVGKDYLVHLMIYGVREVTDFASLQISISAVGASPIVQFNYLISDGHSFRTVAGENDTNLDVLITLDGSSAAATYQLRVNIAAHDVTSTDAVTLSGNYLSQLVGSIT